MRLFCVHMAVLERDEILDWISHGPPPQLAYHGYTVGVLPPDSVANQNVNIPMGFAADGDWQPPRRGGRSCRQFSPDDGPSCIQDRSPQNQRDAPRHMRALCGSAGEGEGGGACNATCVGRRRCTGASRMGCGARGSTPTIGGEGGGEDLFCADSCGLGGGERAHRCTPDCLPAAAPTASTAAAQPVLFARGFHEDPICAS